MFTTLTSTHTEQQIQSNNTQSEECPISARLRAGCKTLRLTIAVLREGSCLSDLLETELSIARGFTLRYVLHRGPRRGGLRAVTQYG